MRAAGAAVWLLLLASLFLVSCGGQRQSAPEGPVEPVDPSLESGWRLARFALQNGQYDQAEVLYERVLARAYARDDATAIGDIGYEYALALLRGGKPAAAAEQALRTRAELERRETAAFAELFLVEAVGRYQSGKPALSRTAAEEAIQRARQDDLETRGRARFILGILAADARDAPAVDRALAAMGTPASDALKADKAELRGRRAMLDGDAATAISAFEEAATLRRELRDYARMARVLASAGVAAEMAGDPGVAADFYYRAGLSAANQEDTAKARGWLSKARDLAAANGLNDIQADARDQLQALEN